MSNPTYRPQKIEGSALTRTFSGQPEHAFNEIRFVLWVVVAVYLVGWAGIPALIHQSPPLDVIESFVWSMDLQAGYYKHPPLPAWITAIAIACAGKHLWVLMLLGPLCILLSLGFLWWLSRQWLDSRRALIVLLLSSTQIYFSFLIPEFNHNVVQLPLWAGAITLFWMTRCSGKLVHAFALGVFMGLCVLGKYSAVILFTFFGLWLLIDKEARSKLHIETVLATLASMAIVCGSNLAWQVANDYPAVSYLQERMTGHVEGWGYFSAAAGFLLAQMLSALVMVFVAALVTRKRQLQEGQPPLLARLYLLASFVVPLTLCLLISMLAGKPLRDMWGMPMLTMTGLALVAWWPSSFMRLYDRRWLIAWLVLQISFLSLYGATQYLSPYSKHALPRSLYPGKEIAETIERSWRQETGDASFAYLIGATWDAGLVAFFSRQTPRVLIDGDFRKAPWVRPEALEKNGAVILWIAKSPNEAAPAWVTRFPVSGGLHSATVINPSYPDLPMTLNWYLLPPAR